jgi:hypothetical protein
MLKQGKNVKVTSPSMAQGKGMPAMKMMQKKRMLSQEMHRYGKEA